MVDSGAGGAIIGPYVLGAHGPKGLGYSISIEGEGPLEHPPGWQGSQVNKLTLITLRVVREQGSLTLNDDPCVSRVTLSRDFSVEKSRHLT